jgi:hypothetical protein
MLGDTRCYLGASLSKGGAVCVDCEKKQAESDTRRRRENPELDPEEN